MNTIFSVAFISMSGKTEHKQMTSSDIAELYGKLANNNRVTLLTSLDDMVANLSMGILVTVNDALNGLPKDMGSCLKITQAIHNNTDVRLTHATIKSFYGHLMLVSTEAKKKDAKKEEAVSE